MFEPQTQILSIMLEKANAWVINLMKQDDDDIDREISNDKSEDFGEFTLSSNIEVDDLDKRQEVLHPDQARHDETIRTTRVPLPKKRSSANIVIANTPLPNPRHLVGAIAAPLLKCQKSAINISRESDIVQKLVIPKAGGDQNVPPPKAGGDRNIPQHQMDTFEIVNQFMEAVIFTNTPWPIISDEKYLMVDEAWQLAIEAQDPQQALAGAPVGAPLMSQLPSGPSLEIYPQARAAVSVYSVFCSSIELMIILNLETYIVTTQDTYYSRAFARWSSSTYCLQLPVGYRIGD